MTWSYSGDPRKNDADQVRFLIQDTDKDDQLIQNEEIKFLLELEGSPLKAAAKSAEIIWAKFARLVDERVGRVSKSFSQRAKHYKDLMKQLRRSAAIKEALPFAGALKESQKDVLEEDNDRVQPSFTRELHDFVRQPNEDQGRAVTAAMQEETDP